MDVDNENEQQLEDKYTSQIAPTPDDENDKRDAVTVGRENFLSIYNERQGGDDDQNDEPDLTNGIKFRRDAEDDQDGFELKTPGGEPGAKGRPMI